MDHHQRAPNKTRALETKNVKNQVIPTKGFHPMCAQPGQYGGTHSRIHAFTEDKENRFPLPSFHALLSSVRHFEESATLDCVRESRASPTFRHLRFFGYHTTTFRKRSRLLFVFFLFCFFVCLFVL